MRWWPWWCGFATAGAVQSIHDHRWGLALISLAFAAFYGWKAHRSDRTERRTTVDMDEHSAVIAAGTIHRGCCLYQHDDDHTDGELVREATRYLQGERGTPKAWALRGVGG